VKARFPLPVKVPDAIGLALHFTRKDAIRKLVDNVAQLLKV
jgi:hypothetical protein